MGGSYKQCVECGKRALSIATRCPGCGREFLAPAAPQHEAVPQVTPILRLRRFLSPTVVGGVLAAAALTAAHIGRNGNAPNPYYSVAAADSFAAASEVAYTLAAATLPDTASAGERLVARTWASVRKARSRRAGLEAVLMPSDTVFADSLERGWYRVALEGEVLGYVHRSMLIPLQGPGMD